MNYYHQIVSSNNINLKAILHVFKDAFYNKTYLSIKHTSNEVG